MSSGRSVTSEGITGTTNSSTAWDKRACGREENQRIMIEEVKREETNGGVGPGQGGPAE